MIKQYTRKINNFNEDEERCYNFGLYDCDNNSNAATNTYCCYNIDNNDSFNSAYDSLDSEAYYSV